MKRKCDKCGKPATNHSVDIIKGKKIEKHLCDQCAMQDPGMIKPVHTPINELLTSFVKMHSGATVQQDLTCEQCGLTYAQFQERSLLGCPNCYTAFEAVLGPLFERAHEGGSHHLGKTPKRAGAGEGRQLRIARLRKRLDEAVAAEDYELAARLRDEIRKFEESAPS